MRLNSLFYAASISLGVSPAVAKEDMTPQLRFVASAMAARGDTQIVVMDKKNATFSFIEEGRLVWQFTALYGRGKGDDIKIDRTTTPAGIFSMAKYRINPKEYKGGMGYAFQCTDICYMVHPMWRGDPSEKRDERLASATAKDNAVSRGGCINLSDDDFDVFEKTIDARIRSVTINGSRMGAYPTFIVLPEAQDIPAIAKKLGLDMALPAQGPK